MTLASVPPLKRNSPRSEMQLRSPEKAVTRCGSTHYYCGMKLYTAKLVEVATMVTRHPPLNEWTEAVGSERLSCPSRISGLTSRFRAPGGVMPVWSRNGHESLLPYEDQQIIVVSYTVNGDSFVADQPRLWAGKKLANVGWV